MNTSQFLKPLTLVLALAGCGGEVDRTAFTHLTIQVRGQAMAALSPADGGTPVAADGGTAAAYAGPELEVKVQCSKAGSPGKPVVIGPRQTAGGLAEFGTNLEPPDNLPAGTCDVMITDGVPANCVPVDGAQQSVEVLDSENTLHEVAIRCEEEPVPPCNPLGDCNENGTPDVREQGEALDPAEPFCELEAIVRESSADGALLNGIEVKVDDLPVVTTGPSAESGDTADGTAAVSGLSCVLPHTVVVSDPTERLGSQSATVEFVKGVTRQVRAFVLQVLQGLGWGNGVLPEISVGERYMIPFSLVLEGDPVGHDQVTSCEAANPAVALADSAPGEGNGLCEWVEGVAPGETTVTACVPNAAAEGGQSCASNTVTVVSAE